MSNDLFEEACCVDRYPFRKPNVEPVN